MIMALLGGLLMAGCSQDDEAGMEPGSAEAIPISFEGTAAECPVRGGSTAAECPVRGGSTSATATRSANGLTGPITSANRQLRHAGFGIFASTQADNTPDLMYNQKVSFTVLADGSDNGYWSYFPLKYWPNDQTIIDRLYFCAYAPFVESTDGLGADATGVVGMSPNTATTTPYILYARARKLDETVDLLWSYIKPTARTDVQQSIQMTMRHALARVAVSLKLSSAPAAGTKVLVRRVMLVPTTLVRSAQLDLCGHDTYTVDENEVVIPTWSNRTMEATAAARTIVIDHDPATTPSSYGIVDNAVRLVPDLPYSWQPDGLNAADYQNALSYDDHQAYLYLIPQDNFSVACTVAYTILASDGTATTGVKTTDGTYDIGTLRGNMTYNLKLNITLP